MKTKEELNELKEEFEAVVSKLEGLSEEELRHVCGGYWIPSVPYCTKPEELVEIVKSAR
ncbi:MAG: hypothetical protein Q4F31_10100 [Eubacteriales bacterium]|nr:hypothetical protein [Eubacteriales bacterium]